MKLSIYTTGGTIDKIYFDAKSAYQVGDPQIADILRAFNVALDYSVTSLMRKDSLDMTETDRERIYESIAADEASHVLVTHGTDTMIDTAKRLQAIGDKTIVLTGALNPARFIGSDAVFNIGCAVGAVQCLPAGVYIVMNGRVWDPERVVKNTNANRFQAIGGA